MFVEEEKETYYLIESFVCLNDCNEQEKKKKMLFFLHASSLSAYYRFKYMKQKRRIKYIKI
jgi:hypothetical protein